MIVAFSVTPIGVGEDVGAAVAEAVRVVRASGLPNQTDAMFTLLEGEWDEVMSVVKQAADAVLAKAPRVSISLKADIRPGRHERDGGQGRLDRGPSRGGRLTMIRADGTRIYADVAYAELHGFRPLLLDLYVPPASADSNHANGSAATGHLDPRRRLPLR